MLAPAVRETHGVIHQQSGNDDIHSLAVADFGVDPAVSREHSSKPSDPFLTLESGILRQTSIQVFFDFVDCQRFLTGEFGECLCVQLGRPQTQIQRARSDLPDFTAQSVGKPDTDQLMKGGLPDEGRIAPIFYRRESKSTHALEFKGRD